MSTPHLPEWDSPGPKYELRQATRRGEMTVIELIDGVPYIYSQGEVI